MSTPEAAARAEMERLRSGGDPDWIGDPPEPTADEEREIARLSALAAGLDSDSDDAEVRRLVALAETIK